MKILEMKNNVYSSRHCWSSHSNSIGKRVGKVITQVLCDKQISSIAYACM